MRKTGSQPGSRPGQAFSGSCSKRLYRLAKNSMAITIDYGFQSVKRRVWRATGAGAPALPPRPGSLSDMRASLTLGGLNYRFLARKPACLLKARPRATPLPSGPSSPQSIVRLQPGGAGRGSGRYCACPLSLAPQYPARAAGPARRVVPSCGRSGPGPGGATRAPPVVESTIRPTRCPRLWGAQG